MKKLFFSLLLVAFLISCKASTTLVPLIIYDYSDLYMQDFMNLILENNTNDILLETYDSKNSQIIQNEIINDTLSENPPLLIVNPVDRLGVYPIIEKAKNLDIPIIFINREPLKKDLDLWDKVYYVGAKAEQSAQLQAQIVMDLFGGDPTNLNQFDSNNDNKIQLVILKGQPGHQDAEIRTDHVISVLEDAGFTLDVLSITEAYFFKDIAKEKMTELIDEFPNKIEIVISNNDAMALGAIEAMVEKELFIDVNGNGKIEHDTEPWIPVIGIDGIPPAVTKIEEGYLYGTVLNDSETMAKAINDLVSILLEDGDINSLPYHVEDDTYIWIDYQTFTSTPTN